MTNQQNEDEERGCADLASIVEGIGSARDATAVINQLLESVFSLERCPAAWVIRPSGDDGNLFRVIASRGEDAPCPNSLVRWPHPGGRDGQPDHLHSQKPSDSTPHPDDGPDPCLVLPLEREGNAVGLLFVAQRPDSGPYTDESVQRLRVVCAHASVALVNAELVAVLQRLTDQLQEEIRDQTKSLLDANETLLHLHEQAERLATVDGLTGLYNHRYFWQRLAEELSRAKRLDRQFSVLFLDVDGLKPLNDSHGHVVGDRALIRIGELLASSTRSCDVAARYGGDEFAVLLIETDAPSAATVAQRLLETASPITVIDEDGREVVVSLSLGTATYPADGATEWELVHFADQEAYRAKTRQKDESIARGQGRRE